jgi:hypothetical protein
LNGASALEIVEFFRERDVQRFENLEAMTEQVAFALRSISFQEFAKDAGHSATHN